MSLVELRVPQRRCLTQGCRHQSRRVFIRTSPNSVSKTLPEHCFGAPPSAYPTPATVCVCDISCLASGLTEVLEGGRLLVIAGWTHEETIESLVRKAGFDGVLTVKFKQTIKVTRYQSSLCTMRYDHYLAAVSEREA